QALAPDSILGEWKLATHCPSAAMPDLLLDPTSASIPIPAMSRFLILIYLAASCPTSPPHQALVLPPLKEATVARDAQSWARLRAHEHRRSKLHDQAVLTRRAGYRRVNATRRARAVGGVDAEAGRGAEVRREAEAAAAAPTGGANRRAGDVGLGGRGGGGRGRRCGGRR